MHLLCIYFFIPWFQYMKFIYSSLFHLHLCRLYYDDQLPALHGYRRGQDSNPGKPDFFQAFVS